MSKMMKIIRNHQHVCCCLVLIMPYRCTLTCKAFRKYGYSFGSFSVSDNFFGNLGVSRIKWFSLRDRLRRTAPHSKAAAIPSGGGFTQNEAIRCAHFFFCLTGLAQARLARRFKQKSPTLVGLLFWLRRVRDSNPRSCYRQRFSRPPHSTTLPTLRRKSTNSLIFCK